MMMSHAIDPTYACKLMLSPVNLNIHNPLYRKISHTVKLARNEDISASVSSKLQR